MREISSASSPGVQRPVWKSPRLSVLGDVCSLTETGSMAQSESPLNACLQSINMDGNTCMG